MAWNESFSHEGGGWTLGETSFATSGPVKDSATSRAGERLAPPVTVSELCSNASPDEKHVLGQYSFSTVYTMGIVRSYQSSDTMVTHVVYDPEDDSKEYNILTYHGVGTDNQSEKMNPFVEGTYIEATGRLRNLNGEYAIMTFSLREVVNEKEYKAFTLEAKIAKLFFANDMYHLLQSGRGEKLTGYPIGAPAAASAPPGGGGGMRNDSMFSQQSRIYDHAPPPAQTSGMGGQRGKILEVLEANKETYGENGMSIDDIKVRVGAMNINQLRSDLDFLVNEGHAYHTINDDNFALIG